MSTKPSSRSGLLQYSLHKTGGGGDEAKQIELNSSSSTPMITTPSDCGDFLPLPSILPSLRVTTVENAAVLLPIATSQRVEKAKAARQKENDVGKHSRHRSKKNRLYPGKDDKGSPLMLVVFSSWAPHLFTYSSSASLTAFAAATDLLHWRPTFKTPLLKGKE